MISSQHPSMPYTSSLLHMKRPTKRAGIIPGLCYLQFQLYFPSSDHEMSCSTQLQFRPWGPLIPWYLGVASANAAIPSNNPVEILAAGNSAPTNTTHFFPMKNCLHCCIEVTTWLKQDQYFFHVFRWLSWKTFHPRIEPDTPGVYACIPTEKQEAYYRVTFGSGAGLMPKPANSRLHIYPSISYAITHHSYAMRLSNKHVPCLQKL